MGKFLILLFACFCQIVILIGQTSITDTSRFSESSINSKYDEQKNRINNIPEQFINSVERKTIDLEEKINSQSEKYLKRLLKEELKLKKLLSKKDSGASREIFNGIESQYTQLEQKLHSGLGKLDKFSNMYDGHLDSLQTVFKYFTRNDNMIQSPVLQKKISDAMQKMNSWQDKLNKTEEINRFLEHRKKYLLEKLNQFGLIKGLKKYQKEIIYYKAQIAEYRNMFDDPSKIEGKILTLLTESKHFRDFFQKHSELSGIFALPGSSNLSAESGIPSGLQTRSSLDQNFEAILGLHGNPQQLLQQNVDFAKSHMDQIKAKLNNMASGGSDIEMPEFSPNKQRSKSFFKRIELGGNFQTVRSNTLYPTSSDIALSAGYKINDKSTFGLQISQQIGWGKNFNNIKVTFEGVGFRSFLDVKIKGSIWASGGAEMIYHSRYEDFRIFKNYTPWQKSALLGLKKTYKAGKMNGNISLLFDFLYKQNLPISQPLLFRVGYIFR